MHVAFRDDSRHEAEKTLQELSRAVISRYFRSVKE